MGQNILSSILLTISVSLSIVMFVTPITNFKLKNQTETITFTQYESQTSDRSIELVRINAVNKNYKDDIKIIGWIPDWDYKDGFNTLKANSNTIDSVSPFWFEPNEDGSLKTFSHTNDPELLEFVKQNNIELMPTIFLFNETPLDKILTSKENTQRHISEIINYVNNNNYDGIDLDYESTYLSNKKLFLEFLETLKLELAKTNKKLSFTALPKWGDYAYYTGFFQTKAVQDYTEIGKIVDEFRLMTYDLNGRYSQEIAPIAPLEWIEDVIKYTIYSGVEREKIYVGVHNYAYDFTKKDIAQDIKSENEYLSFYNINITPATALTLKDIQKIKDNYSYTITYNKEWGESLLEYNFKGTDRIVVFIDEKGINARKDLAKEYGIGGVAFWRLGRDNNLIY